MKLLKSITAAAAVAVAALGSTACNDTTSYADLLNDEARMINNYLANHVVVNEIPADTVFKTVAELGKDAPFYKLDEDGNIYMQVINAGTKDNRAKYDEVFYFRFTRYDLSYYVASTDTFTTSWGNETDMGLVNPSFRYQNFTNPDSYKWGIGIQYPLTLLPVDAEVNIIVKSALGLPSEEAKVIPYVYHLRYYRPKI